MNDWFPFLLGIAGIGATIYGTRSTRKTAQEASTEKGIHDTLSKAVEVNSLTYQALATEQKETIKELRAELASVKGELEGLRALSEEQKDTIEKLQRQIEEMDHGPLAS